MLTYQFTVDAVGDPEPIVAQSICIEIRLCEAGGLSSNQFNLRAPLKTSPPFQLGLGADIRIQPDKISKRFFQPGETVGYLETLSGTATVSQLEL